MSEPVPPSDYPHRVLESTRRYVEELLGDLGDLQRRLHEQDQEIVGLREEVSQLRNTLDARRDEQERREGEQGQRGDSTSGQSARFADIEKQNQDLANLYVASFQLHGSPERETVIQAMKEIVINLIGSEEFGIWEIAGGRRTLIADFGATATQTDLDDLLDKELGQALASGQTIVVEEPRNGQPLACIPLRLGMEVVGAIAIFHLLPHKPALEQIDHELFELLAAQSASALYLAELHAAQNGNPAVH